MMVPSSFLFRHRYTFLFTLIFMSIASILLWHFNITSFDTNAIFQKFKNFPSLPIPFKPSSSPDHNKVQDVTSAQIIPISPLQVPQNRTHPNLLTDKRKLSRVELLEEVADSIRNLPRPPFMSEQWSTTYFNGSCAVSPSILDVKFVNTYWQIVNKTQGAFYMFGAYYDTRNLTVKSLKGPVVRILGMLDKYLEPNVTETDYCQLRFENETQPIITKIIERHYAWNRYFGNGLYHPYVFACQIPPSHHSKVPKSVSIVKQPCDNALNILGLQFSKVQYSKPAERKTFGVCVKGLHMPDEEDISIQLVEWIELMRLLGADKIFLYEYQVHPNISKVMRHYQSTGFVDVIPLTLPGYLPGDHRLVHLYHTSSGKRPSNWMNELIPLNDCLYRNLYNFEYLVLIDTDEVIMPLKNISTWNELIKDIEKERPKDFNQINTIGFRNVYFLDTFMNNRSWFPGIPWYMHHLQHVYRADIYSQVGHAVKAFHKVDRILTFHNHFPTNCLEGCRGLHINETKAHLCHYKPECPGAIPNCTETVGRNPTLDTTIWKYKDKFIERTEGVLKTLGFIPDPLKDSSWLLVQVPNDFRPSQS